jgi:hypothetical protein
LQQQTAERARKALMEMHLNAMFEALSNLKTVYRSRIKVDAFELLQANSESMLKHYKRV